MTHPETKRLLVHLARRLRSPGAVPAAELATVPNLLQRYGLRDQQLFEDFCRSTSASWQALSPPQMSTLFRGTENYQLLHATKGPALPRLIDSLLAALRQEPDAEGAVPLSRPAALGALCHGALAPKGRAACRPLLEELRVALQAQLEGDALSHGDALELLGAGGELHRAVGVGKPTLQTLAELGRKALLADKAEDGEALSPGQLSLAARAAGRLLPALGDEAKELFQALLAALSKREAKNREPVFRACQQLDPSLRRLLADADLINRPDDQVSLNGIEVRLQILHDLPLQAAARGDPEACKTLARWVEAWLQKLLEAKEAPAHALATAYLAASTVRHAFLVAEEEASAAAAAGLATEALKRLAGHWREISAEEVNLLFRSPGDVSDVTAEAIKHAARVQDPLALASLLQASHALPQAPELATASRTALLSRIEAMTDPIQLSTLEAATRKGAEPSEDELPAMAELRQRIRSQLFRAVLEAKPIWHSKPNRGFIRYVEKCLERDRRPKEVEATLTPGAAPEEAGAQPSQAPSQAAMAG